MTMWKAGRTYPNRTAPLRVPVLFFASGALGILAGSAQLGLASPWILNGRTGAGPVLAAVHLFTLAGFSTLMMGALYQFLPVLLNTPPVSPRRALWQWVVFVAGVGAFAGGLAGGHASAVRIGAGGMVAGVLWFLVNAFGRIRERRTWNFTAWYFATGLFYLALAMGVGALLVLRMLGGWPPVHHLLAVHLVLALGGWWGMTLAGSSYRLWAMFGRTHREPRRWRLTWTLANAGLIVLIAGYAGNWPTLREGAWVVTACAVATLLGDLVPASLSGWRHLADPALMAAATAPLGLVAFEVFGTLSLFAHAHLWPTALIAYGLGWVGLSALGFVQKIVPFMVWLHRYAHPRGGRKMPRLSDIWPPTRMYAPCGSATLGAAAMAFAVFARSETLLQVGCALEGLAWAVLAAAGWRAVRGPHRFPAER